MAFTSCSSPARWFHLGVGLKYQGEVMADHSMAQEVRLEFEPGFQVQLRLAKLVNRHRMELRYYPGQLPSGYRDRTRVQMVVGDETWPGLPQVSNEIFVAIALTAFNRNRLIVGISIPMGEIPRLELANMFRSRLAADKWEHDHLRLRRQRGLSFSRGGAIDLLCSGDWQAPPPTRLCGVTLLDAADGVAREMVREGLGCAAGIYAERQDDMIGTGTRVIAVLDELLLIELGARLYDVTNGVAPAFRMTRPSTFKVARPIHGGVAPWPLRG